MALQWFLLGVVAAVEAAVLLLLSAPMPREVSKQVLEFVRRILQPGLAVVPFALFQLLEVYWKYEHRINCAKQECSPFERDRFQRSFYKSHRNALLAISAALLYWLLFRIAKMQQELQQAETRVKLAKEL
jgi:preprotein translocase subunit Sec63